MTMQDKVLFENSILYQKWWFLFDSVIIENCAASRQNQQNGMCAQQRLRSAWASAQSDQSLRCPREESLGP